ncbi:ubiquitin-related domain-containing protein [Chytridium lagenaria]|nr:ubiquitin-related domain-containing protein [Chytridium lagenaria]
MKTASISLNVGLLTGKSFSVDVRLTDTVNDLKRRIEEEESIPRDSQVLIFREKPLANESFIGDLGIREGSKLQLVVQMNGGNMSYDLF